MELPELSPKNKGLVRIASTAALAIIAVRSFLQGHRLRGLLAAGGAVAVGSTVSTLEPTPVEIEHEAESAPTDDPTESTIEQGALQCPICNGPIVPGESRRPNENDDIVHEACLA